ncbi:uncharacterized protein LOC109838736 [Asparagus officinalis]|uniref:uncharacterized protein LOC109838736 n=1 Tax=Asparagus officinalis TaxID=4686 RepID=UPI00098E2FB3|nr:uncharacterized protein LOC109838736 [Asparagus officinalis]
MRKIYCRNDHFKRIFEGYSDSCRSYIRMRPKAFFKLADVMRNHGFLKDTKHLQVEEQLAMFLYIVGHKTKNRVIRTEFIRSSETVSRYFNKILQAMNGLRDRYMKQTPNEIPPEIVNNPNYFPYFKDCIGMIDGTHIDAILPSNLVARFRGRKCVTQNVLAACTPNKLFTYVLAGWEGKYYLCDAGYTTMSGFISPYHGVRYHLKEQIGRTPRNSRELFNLRHSSLWSKIKSTFGTLKNRFTILSAKPNYPFPTQVDIVLACTILHNFITIEDPQEDILNQNVLIDEENEDVTNEYDSNVVDFNQSRTQREERDARNEWKDLRDQIAWTMWVDYCVKYKDGDTTEIGL